MKLINLTGAKNFIGVDGVKFTSVDNTNTPIHHEVTDKKARELLQVVNGNDVPYFTLSVLDKGVVESDDLDDKDLDDKDLDDKDLDEEDIDEEDIDDESEDETPGEDVVEPKTTTKKVLKVGGKGKKAEKQVSV